MELSPDPTRPAYPDPRVVAELERLAREELAARLVHPMLGGLPADPLTASDRELEAHGLPPRPDPAFNLPLSEFWHEMLRPPLAAVAPEFVPDGLSLRSLALAASRGATTLGAVAHAGARWGTSRNWSGAVLTAQDGMRFTTVAASWTVPEPKLPDGASAAAPPPGGAWQVSAWIGLDGFRRFSLSLPQVGTVSRLAVAPGPNPPAGTLVPETYLFVQWWVRDKGYGEIKVPQLQVSPGNEIHAKLVLRGNANVSFHVTNRSTGKMLNIAWAPGVFVKAPDWQMNQPLRTEAPAEGLNAVFCVERPGIPPAPGASLKPELIEKYRLPGFDEVAFRGAQAEMRRPGGPPVHRDLTGARWLRMAGPVEDARPPRSAVEAGPDAPAPVGRRFVVRPRA